MSLPLEILIHILSFIYNNEDSALSTPLSRNKIQLLNFRLVNKYFVSIIDKFCQIQLNKCKNYKFIIYFNRKQYSERTKWIYKILNTQSTNYLQFANDRCYWEYYFKLTINKDYLLKFILKSSSENINSKTDFILNPNSRNAKIKKIGDKQNTYLIDLQGNFTLNNFTFYHHHTFDYSEDKSIFKNCCFSKGLLVVKDFTDLINCDIHQEIFVIFKFEYDVTICDHKKIQQMFKTNRFFNKQGKEIDYFKNKNFIESFDKRRLEIIKNFDKKYFKIPLFSLKIEGFKFECK